MRARYYDPATGQFITQDPLEAITGQPYGYAGENPLNFVDPSGRCGWWCVTGLVLTGISLGTGLGEVVVGVGLTADLLGTTAALTGAAGTGIDLAQCTSGSVISCWAAAAGGAGLAAGVAGESAAAVALGGAAATYGALGAFGNNNAWGCE